MSEYEFRELLLSGRAPYSFLCGFSLVSALTGGYATNQTPSTKIELAKKWLKDNGGAHPGCLNRFMQARGMVCKS